MLTRAVRTLSPATALWAPCDAQSEVEWEDDLTVARRLAAEQGKPLLVLFRQGRRLEVTMTLPE